MTPPALLAISHGTASAAGQAAVEALVEAVAARLPDVTVRLGHVDVQQPDVPTSLEALGDEERVILVPLLLSAGYHVHVDLVEQSAGWERATISAALGPDARLAALLEARLSALHPGPDDAIVLAVAGSSDDRANEDCRLTGRLLSERLGVPVEVGFLAAADPPLGTAVEASRSRADRVVVADYLLAPGYFHDLAVQVSGGAPVARPLLDDDTPAPELVDIVVDRYRSAC